MRTKLRVAAYAICVRSGHVLLAQPAPFPDPVVGMNVTIYDPERDRDGSAGRGLVDGLVRLLA